ncbi:hypothetical protein BBF96_12075 [Anoxybacter fermentans]|uniref:DNA mismatch repair proteins mutS family domain-containing protein n=1 Tax=Anoxybacter fermentans TaxID=1323375 RepID=A0A3S9T0I5_9FIRM|nr:hypothetical protein [Anoxybacter fermentans]AZR74068.1 hypothetical protein BBF96_12075 [Anoxybacter fermentans]
MFFILDTADRLGFTEVFSKINPCSPQGQRVKRSIQPFLPGDEEKFDQMTRRLTFWLELGERTDLVKKIRPLLAELKNIHGILERLAKGESLNEGECFEIKANLVITRKIWKKLKSIVKMKLYNRDMLLEPILKIDPLDRLWELLNPGGIETERFYLRDEYDRELARVRREKNELQQRVRRLKREMLAELESRLGRTIPASGEVMVSKGDTELLEYLNSRSDLRLERESFSTCFYKWIPGPAVQKLENELEQLNIEEEQISKRVLAELSQKIRNYVDCLQKNQQRLGELDWMLAKVEYALKHQCVPPVRIDENMIQILRGRHLLVEAEVKERGDEYTPIDLTLKRGVTVITGPNMGGKTLNLRMVGLLTAMAQYGLYVPAEEMRFSLREFIYFSVDDDQTKGDLSTFGQEIVGLNQALPLKDRPGLYLIDELARGTNPEEGGALGKAIIKYLLDSPAITILTTHFAILTNVQGVRHLKVKGLDREKYKLLLKKYQMEGKVSLDIINQLMDYHLIEAEANNEIARDAIRVAALLGLPEQIIKDALKELDGKV